MKSMQTLSYLRMLSLFALLVGWGSCENTEPTPEKSLEEIRAEGGINSSIIRNPISADGVVDTVNVAKIDFAEAEYDFGEVFEGAVIERKFRFTNTGAVPLLISNARSTCGCTVPEWPETPIAPGDEGVINVRFDTKNKEKVQRKYVTITANTYPSQTKVLVKGYVRPRVED